MRAGENCRKTLRVFPTKGLRSAARIICPSQTDKFHTGSPSCIFSHAHVARENDFISLPPAGGKLCEAFLTRCPDPQKRGSGLFFCNQGNEGRGEASAPTEVYLAVRRGGALPLPRATARVAPTDGQQGVRCGRRIPQSRLRRAPFRQGGRGDGGTDCHSQCAHWLRNDRLQGVRWGGPMWASAPTKALQGMRCKSGRATARVAPTEM